MAKFAELRAQAAKNIKVKEPFTLELEGDEPPIVITAWDDLERDVRLSELIGADGKFARKDQREILELFCGDAFPRVWELFRKEHAAVMTELVNALIEHFKDDIDSEADELPGGTEASSV